MRDSRKITLTAILTIFLIGVPSGLYLSNPYGLIDDLSKYQKSITQSSEGYLVYPSNSRLSVGPIEIETDSFGFRKDFDPPAPMDEDMFGVIGSWLAAGWNLENYQSISHRLNYLLKATYGQSLKSASTSVTISSFKDLTVGGNSFDQQYYLIQDAAKKYNTKRFVWIISDFDFINLPILQSTTWTEKILWPLLSGRKKDTIESISLEKIYAYETWEKFKTALTRLAQLKVEHGIQVYPIAISSSRLTSIDREEFHYAVNKAIQNAGFAPCPETSNSISFGPKNLFGEDNYSQTLAANILICLLGKRVN